MIEDAVPTHDELIAYLDKEIAYAFKARSREAMYEAHGKLVMARKLRAIERDEYVRMDGKLCKNGINRPSAYD